MAHRHQSARAEHRGALPSRGVSMSTRIHDRGRSGGSVDGDRGSNCGPIVFVRRTLGVDAGCTNGALASCACTRMCVPPCGPCWLAVRLSGVLITVPSRLNQ
jgi:hypothetical protein